MSTKLVTIPHRGPIIPLGGVYGPITHAHHMDMTTIRILVTKGYEVDEHLNNGKVIRLDLNNYAKDNNASEGIEVDRVEEAPAAVQEPVVEEKVEVVEEPAPAEEPAQKQGKKNRNRQDNVEKK